MLKARLCDSVRAALAIGRHTGTQQRVRSQLAIGALGLIANPVFAQDTSQNNTPEQLETISVTGTQIRRVDIETSNPVITIDRATIQKTGKLTLGDLVQELPVVTGPNSNPQVNNGGGNGVSTIGLRGLGSQRTLILIDGHRFLGSNPNDIPANMIERIEVLTDGASSVYGSDAVAGVVNFILRSEYQGAEFTANYGISDRDDGAQRGYQFTFGQTGDKGSIMAGISYNKTDQVIASHRDFSKTSVSLYGTNGLSSFAQLYGQQIPQGFIGGSSVSPYGHIQIPDAFADLFPNCQSGFLARNPGTNGQNVATDYHCYVNNGTATTPTDRYNFASVNLIMTPQERTGVFLNGNYKLTDHIEVYAAVMHNKAASAFQLAPAIYRTAAGVVISQDSYYNPFGVEFGPGETTFDARLASLGNRRGAFGVNDDHASTGFRGSFEAWDQPWNWEAGLDYGHYAYTNNTEGLPNIDILNRETGPSFYDATTGSVRCGTPGHAIDGCVPINPFDLNDPNTIAELTRAGAPASTAYFQQERVVRADLRGSLIDLPAGTAQLAVGASYRQDYTRSTVDTSLVIDHDTLTCTLGSQCTSPLQGGYHVREIYAELFVPLLRDVPFVHALNVTLGDRYSKYSSFGTTSNGKFALEWRPVEDLLLRSTVSDVFRAPTVTDIFAGPQSSQFSLSHDPCDGYTGNPPNPACVHVPTDGSFRNNAVAEQLPIDGVFAGPAYAGLELGPEYGRSYDFGIVYDPNWLEGVSVSADAWRIYIKNNITIANAQSVLDLCAAGFTTYCPLIRRVASGPDMGQIQSITQTTVNLGRTDVKGVDFALHYRMPAFSFGRLSISFNATYMAKFDAATAPGTDANQLYHYAGHFLPPSSAQATLCPGASGGVCLYPRWRALSSLNWQRGPFDASWRMRYIGRFSLGSRSPSQDVFPAGTCYYGDYCTLHGYVIEYGATVYHDLQFGYNLEAWNTRIDVGINNVGDKQPPFLWANNSINANTDPSDFDLQGRYYWSSVTVKF
jgi:outer membrane receptor protein involved in Fe transport